MEEFIRILYEVATGDDGSRGIEVRKLVVCMKP